MRIPRTLALVLAGGKGSRMGCLTEDRPKPTLPVGGTYRLIDISLSNLAHSHISHIGLVQQYLPHPLNNYVSAGRPWDLDRNHGGLQVLPPFEGGPGEGFAEGNADAVHRQRDIIREHDPEIVIVLSADHLYTMNFLDAITTHLDHEADLTIVTTQVDESAARYGVVTVDNTGRVTKFDYKPDEPTSDLVTTEVFLYRTEVLLATLLAHASGTFPSLSAIVLNGPFPLPADIDRLIDGLGSRLPIIATDRDTYDTSVRIMNTRGRLAADSQRSYDTALSLFERHVDGAELTRLLGLAKPTVVTPLMFEYGLVERARSNRRRIVLPEGDDDRVLRAAEILQRRDVCDLVVLGPAAAVRELASREGVDLTGIELVDPADSPDLERYAQEYARLRAHKGVDAERAREVMQEGAYFGTMMVHLGDADGMVSGAAHTTANTIRPALEFVKTKEGVGVVSSVFFMLLEDRVLVYGDCAVNPNPNAEQLADIAKASAQTARAFGVDPRVAMLSYSTGSSGSGEDVERVTEATRLVQAEEPDFPVEGPIQYDAAVDASIAQKKLPGSEVAGHATVFVFPDLNTGNNTYKAVQQSAGAVAVGPVLQGLRKPVNDLSRGTTVEDIVNTVAITAIQAQNG